MDPFGDRSLRVTGKLRACFLYFDKKISKVFAYIKKKQ